MLKLDQINANACLSSAQELPAPAATKALGAEPSALALAQAELAEFQSDALAETQEDLSFALGGKLRETRRSPSTQDNVRGRVLAQKILLELESVEPVTLEALLEGPTDWQHSPQLLTALRQQLPDAGQAALQLAATLVHQKPGGALRRRLEQALMELAADDMLSLSLFGALEFGGHCTPALRQELRSLYQRANAQHPKMSQWLAALGARNERTRKLNAMLRVLSFELSASAAPIVGSHLAAVMDDLRQLLRLLGLQTYCDQAANALALPNLDGEALLSCVVKLMEQVWLSADTLAEVLPAGPAVHAARIGQTLFRLIQLLPEAGFNDAEHRAQIEAALLEFLDSPTG